LKLTILFFIIISNFGFSQIEISNDTLIEWNKPQKLKWTDFKGKPLKEPGITVAATQCHVKVVDSYFDNKGIPIFTVKCYFSKNESWTIVSNLETLEHEQLHFDLWEFITRKIRKAFSELNNASEKNVSVYQKKYGELIDYGIELQNQYDSESYFSEKGQNKWNKKILNGLKKLDKYAL
jgi:hypothetical protein